MLFRKNIQGTDPDQIEQLVRATGFFNGEEIAIARELAEERLEKGVGSGYFFICAEGDEGAQQLALAGYACYGPIPGTKSSFDLYWIAVHPGEQGRGLGRRLLHQIEVAVQGMGGSRIYIDTSSRDQYASTRTFYQRCGYLQAALLPDFYAPGDGKIIFCKKIPFCA